MSFHVLSVFASYNFPYYLRNTVESYLEFFPWGDALVVDNGSTHGGMAEVLDTLGSSARIEVVRRSSNDHRRKVGSLYDAYNLAAEHAISHGYEFIHFMADDVQYLWTDPSLPRRVERIFERRPNVSNVGAMFHKRIRDYDGIPALVQDADNGCYVNQGYGVGDDGFFQVEFLRKSGFRFMDSENEHSAFLHRQGYRMHFLRNPYIAFVPWVATRRKGRRFGEERPPVRKYYLRPLDPRQVRQLEARPISDLPFTDDYAFPWGYAALSPYWFTTPSLEYLEGLTIRRLRHGRKVLWPHFERRGMDGSIATLPWWRIRHDPSLRFLVQRLSMDALGRCIGAARRMGRRAG